MTDNPVLKELKMSYLNKYEIIEKLQTLPDLPIVVMNDSHSGTIDKVTSIKVVKASNLRFNPNSDSYFLCDDSCDSFTHEVILIS
jgi:CRISPR/Cas system CSM-associated protein Csm4 (group 5 of RAMP superfamily)